MKNVHKGGPLWPTDRPLLRKSAENRAPSRPPAGEFAGGTAGVLPVWKIVKKSMKIVENHEKSLKVVENREK